MENVTIGHVAVLALIACFIVFWVIAIFKSKVLKDQNNSIYADEEN